MALGEKLIKFLDDLVVKSGLGLTRNEILENVRRIEGSKFLGSTVQPPGEAARPLKLVSEGMRRVSRTERPGVPVEGIPGEHVIDPSTHKVPASGEGGFVKKLNEMRKAYAAFVVKTPFKPTEAQIKRAAQVYEKTGRPTMFVGPHGEGRVWHTGAAGAEPYAFELSDSRAFTIDHEFGHPRGLLQGLDSPQEEVIPTAEVFESWPKQARDLWKEQAMAMSPQVRREIDSFFRIVLGEGVRPGHMSMGSELAQALRGVMRHDPKMVEEIFADASGFMASVRKQGFDQAKKNYDMLSMLSYGAWYAEKNPETLLAEWFRKWVTPEDFKNMNLKLGKTPAAVRKRGETIYGKEAWEQHEFMRPGFRAQLPAMIKQAGRRVEVAGGRARREALGLPVYSAALAAPLVGAAAMPEAQAAEQEPPELGAEPQAMPGEPPELGADLAEPPELGAEDVAGKITSPVSYGTPVGNIGVAAQPAAAPFMMPEQTRPGVPVIKEEQFEDKPTTAAAQATKAWEAGYQNLKEGTKQWLESLARGGLYGADPGAVQMAQGVGELLAPEWAPIENVLRMAASRFGPTVFPKAKGGDIMKLGEGRPTTGNWAADVGADLTAGLLPVGAVFKLLKTPGRILKFANELRRAENLPELKLLPEAKLWLETVASRGRGPKAAIKPQETGAAGRVPFDVVAPPGAQKQITRGAIPVQPSSAVPPTLTEPLVIRGTPTSELAVGSLPEPALAAEGRLLPVPPGTPTARLAKESGREVPLTPEELKSASADAQMRETLGLSYIAEPPTPRKVRSKFDIQQQTVVQPEKAGIRAGTREPVDMLDVTFEPGVLQMERQQAEKQRQFLLDEIASGAYKGDDLKKMADQVKKIDEHFYPRATEEIKPIDLGELPSNSSLAVQSFFRPVDKIVEKYAPQLVNTIRTAFRRGNKYEHKFLELKNEILKGLSNEEKQQLIQVMRGKVAPINDKVKVAAERLRNEVFDPIIGYAQLPEITKHIGQVGRLENYFPGMRSEEMLAFAQARSMDDIMREAERLEKLGLEVAQDVHYIRDPQIKNYLTSFFKKRAQEIEPTISIERVIDAYIAGTRKTLFDIPAVIRAKGLATLVPEAVVAKAGAKKLNARALADKYLDFYIGAPSIGTGFEPLRRLEGFISNRVYSSLLGLNFNTSGRNLTQLINTAAWEGMTPTVKAFFQQFGKKRREAFRKTGELLDFPGLETSALERQTRLEKGISGFVMKPFSTTEAINRRTTWTAVMERVAKGQRKIQETTQMYRLALQEGRLSDAARYRAKLEKLAKATPEHGTGGTGFREFDLTPAEEQAAERIAQTQFTYGRVSPFVESVYGKGAPGMKLATQMLSYGRRQFNVATELMEHARKTKDFAPLARFVTLWGTTIGLGIERATSLFPGARSPLVQVINELEEVKRGRMSPQKWLTNVAFLMTPAGLQIKKEAQGRGVLASLGIGGKKERETKRKPFAPTSR